MKGRSMIKRAICTALLSLSASCGAEQNTARLSAELVALYDMEGQIRHNVEASIGRWPTIDSSIIARELDAIFASSEWKDAKRQEAESYAELFTENELREIISFFKTSAGQAYLKHNTAIMSRRGAIYSNLAATFQKRLQVIGTTENAESND